MDIVQLLNDIDAAVWGVPMILFLVGTHLYFTVRMKFIQRKLPLAIKKSFIGGGDEEGDITPFQALATALAATIGTGSIVGVATAILSGGPGSLFWMWIIGMLGMATKYAEIFAAVRYRVKDAKGEMIGGAMYIWDRAFIKNGKRPWWAKLGAVLFALFMAIAAIGTGCAVQSSAITGIITSSGLAAPNWLLGLIVAILVAVVIFGGVQTISKVCEKLVPFMAVAYGLGCIIILVMNNGVLLEAIALVFQCAFTPHAAFGGAVGSGVIAAMQFGAARGLFSNEAGMGTAAIIAAAAKTKNPSEQALIGMTGVFWSTGLICVLSGLVLICTMLGNPQISAEILANPSVYTGAKLASTAFATIPYIGTPVLVLGLCTFAYSTILGWGYYGSRCVTYLFGPAGVKPYQAIYVIGAFLGAIGIGDLVWTIADITNALMAIPNLIVILLLSGVIARETDHYVYDDNMDELDERHIPTMAELEDNYHEAR